MAERMTVSDVLIRPGEMVTHVGEGPYGMLVAASGFIDRMDRMFFDAEPLLGTYVSVLYLFEGGNENEQRVPAPYFRNAPGQALHDHYEQAIQALWLTTPTYSLVPLQRIFLTWTYDDGIGPTPVIEETPPPGPQSRFERNFEV